MWLENRYFKNKISGSIQKKKKKREGVQEEGLRKTNSVLQPVLGIPYLATLGQWLRTY